MALKVPRVSVIGAYQITLEHCRGWPEALGWCAEVVAARDGALCDDVRLASPGGRRRLGESHRDTPVTWRGPGLSPALAFP
ncbi:hypothetical protein Aple_091750 [Acrocarpospora pleiomorpha]|uniref:Uncharacterized protein n=1 Tax=Acrocarpospora pleiomorpha TaxID=90975 RepID=A0A5M3XZD2_9ACTN|nr:hypothetical protein Aple_091750 [Acrocarpospora pleiomorpha]